MHGAVNSNRLAITQTRHGTDTPLILNGRTSWTLLRAKKHPERTCLVYFGPTGRGKEATFSRIPAEQSATNLSNSF